jgi:hypothetical protein
LTLLKLAHRPGNFSVAVAGCFNLREVHS